MTRYGTLKVASFAALTAWGCDGGGVHNRADGGGAGDPWCRDDFVPETATVGDLGDPRVEQFLRGVLAFGESIAGTEASVKADCDGLLADLGDMAGSDLQESCSRAGVAWRAVEDAHPEATITIAAEPPDCFFSARDFADAVAPCDPACDAIGGFRCDATGASDRCWGPATAGCDLLCESAALLLVHARATCSPPIVTASIGGTASPEVEALAASIEVHAPGWMLAHETLIAAFSIVDGVLRIPIEGTGELDLDALRCLTAGLLAMDDSIGQMPDVLRALEICPSCGA